MIPGVMRQEQVHGGFGLIDRPKTERSGMSLAPD